MTSKLRCMICCAVLLVVMLSGAPGRDCPPQYPITVSLMAQPDPACVGQQVTFTASASDPDIVNGQLVYDSVNCTWSIGGSGSTVTHTYSQAGTYEVSVTADDQPLYYDDSPVTATITVKVCNVTLSSTTNDPLIVGCGYENTGRFVWANISQNCAGLPVSWDATAPLSKIGEGTPGGQPTVEIRANEPSGCSETGSVTAQVGGCTASLGIEVRKSGPYTVTPVGGSSTVRYCGEQTFADLGVDPPPGCQPSDHVYGIQTFFGFLMESDCPIPTDCKFGETLALGDGCSCKMPDPASQDFSGGATGPWALTDKFGFYTCDAWSDEFNIAIGCKIKQTYYVGPCTVTKQCVHLQRVPNYCNNLVQIVTITSGWDDCGCN